MPYNRTIPTIALPHFGENLQIQHTEVPIKAIYMYVIGKPDCEGELLLHVFYHSNFKRV